MAATARTVNGARRKNRTTTTTTTAKKECVMHVCMWLRSNTTPIGTLRHMSKANAFSIDDWLGYRLSGIFHLYHFESFFISIHSLVHSFTHFACSLTVTRLKMCRLLSSASYVNSYKLLIYGFYRYENELRATQCPCHMHGHTNISPFYWHFGCGTSQQHEHNSVSTQHKRIQMTSSSRLHIFCIHCVDRTAWSCALYFFDSFCHFFVVEPKKDKRIFASQFDERCFRQSGFFFLYNFFLSIWFRHSTPILSEFLYLLSFHPYSL